MKQIRVKSGIWKKKGLVLIEFPFDQELIDRVKTLPGIVWNSKRKAWILPYAEDTLNQILATFKGIAWVDYSQFQNIKPEKLLANLPDLSPELFEEIRKFTARAGKSLENVFKQADKRLELKKKPLLHWQQRSKVNHLLQSATDHSFIQDLFGHNSNRKTEICSLASQKSL
ncbi:hypothetical protein [Algoriphagus namhaensis]